MMKARKARSKTKRRRQRRTTHLRARAYRLLMKVTPAPSHQSQELLIAQQRRKASRKTSRHQLQMSSMRSCKISSC